MRETETDEGRESHYKKGGPSREKGGQAGRRGEAGRRGVNQMEEGFESMITE